MSNHATTSATEITAQVARAIKIGGYTLSPGSSGGQDGWIASISIHRGGDMLGTVRVDHEGPGTRRDSIFQDGGKLDGVPEIILSQIQRILESRRNAYCEEMYRLIDAGKH